MTIIPITEAILATGRPVCQGEVNVWKYEYAPPELKAKLGGDLKEAQLENGELILGHSETGHHHVLVAERPGAAISDVATALIADTNQLLADLTIVETCILEHRRSTDTHLAHSYPANRYIIGNRREHDDTIGGWRRVTD